VGGIEVIVTKPGTKAVIVVDKATGRLLLFTTTYNSKIRPGVYSRPEEVFEVFKYLATKGHETVLGALNVNVVYEVVSQILKMDIPPQDKLKEVSKYLRSQRLG